MSEPAAATSRPLLWCGALLLLLTATPSAAQTTFNPTIFISSFYTTNFEFLGEPTKETESAGYSLGLTLPVMRRTRSGVLSAQYSTGFESFSEVELDNGRHHFALNYLRQGRGGNPGRGRGQGSGLRLNLRYSLTEDQGTRRNLAENQLFLGPRAKSQFGGVGLNWGRSIGRRFNLRLRGNYSTWRYDQFQVPAGIEEPGEIVQPGDPGETEEPGEIEEPGDPGTVVPRGFRDRDAFGGGIGISKSLTQSLRLGFAYGYRHFELSNFGEQDIHSVSLTFGYRIARVVSVRIAAGGFRRTSTNVQLEEGGESSRSGFQLTFGLGRSWRLGAVTLGVRAGHAPNVGGGPQVGTATVTRVGFSLRPGRSRGRVRHFQWRLSANYARRDPVSDLLETIENVTLGGGISYRLSQASKLGRVVNLVLGTNWVDQTSRAAINRGQFFRVNVGLAIKPLGLTRIARR